MPKFMESERIHVKGLIVADYSEKYSHWNAKESLSEWLKRDKIPAIRASTYEGPLSDSENVA